MMQANPGVFSAVPFFRAVLACSVLGANLLLSGCESLSEPILVERKDLYDEHGVHVWADLNDDLFRGRYWEFSAYNGGSDPVCVKLALSVPQSNGYNFYELVYLPPGQMFDFGYINEPANWRVEDGRVWTSYDNSCPH